MNEEKTANALHVGNSHMESCGRILGLKDLTESKSVGAGIDAENPIYVRIPFSVQITA